MRAIRYHEHGDSAVLRADTIDPPVAASGHVVVRVAGTTFNFLDVALREGILRDVMPVALPHIPGIDVAGVVSEVGDDVDGWSVGDAVVALLPPTEPGAAAEYVAAPAELLAAAPRTVELADTAALPVAGLTAWQALFENARLENGQRILINGAGGGVGGAAVQLAKRAGAHVTATASPGSRDRVHAAGADRIVDHTETPLREAVAGEGFDVVLELVRESPEDTAALVDLVADGGVLASATTPGPSDPGRGVRVEQVGVRSDAAMLADLVGLVDAGELVVDVAERRPLTELAATHDDAMAGRLRGKTVLIPG